MAISEPIVRPGEREHDTLHICEGGIQRWGTFQPTHPVTYNDEHLDEWHTPQGIYVMGGKEMTLAEIVALIGPCRPDGIPEEW